MAWVAVSVASFYLTGLIGAGAFDRLGGWPEQIPLFSVVLGTVVGAGLYSVLGFALFRASLRPEQSSFAGLRLTADEFRLMPIIAVFALGLATLELTKNMPLTWQVGMMVALAVLATPICLIPPTLFDSRQFRPALGLSLAGRHLRQLIPMNLILVLAAFAAQWLMASGLNAYSGALARSNVPVGPMLFIVVVLSTMLHTLAFVMIVAAWAGAYRALKPSDEGIETVFACPLATAPSSPPAALR